LITQQQQQQRLSRGYLGGQLLNKNVSTCIKLATA
jgi:hypothetical protein